MLKRITKIQNIGRFSNASCGGCQFDKITFIHGRNTYGKSTLGDIFSSLEKGDLDSITKRKTIPRNTTPQSASLSFLGLGSSEVPVILSQSGWQNALPDGLKLHVFDDGFYHESVFSSRKFNRDTKEKLSAFILGQQGVSMALTIAEKNKEKNDSVRRVNVLKKDVLQGVGDIPQFLSMSVTELQPEIQEKTDDLRKQYDNLSRQQKNSTAIKARQELSKVAFTDYVTDKINQANIILGSSVESHHEDAKRNVTLHIEKNFTSTNGAEKWIAQGLVLNNNHSCNFCGQSLTTDAVKLIDSYREYFNDAYLKHESLVNQQLDPIISGLSSDSASQLKLLIEKNNSAVGMYPELLETESFAKLKAKLSAEQLIFNDLLGSYVQEISKTSDLLKTIVSKKKESPHIALPEIPIQSINALLDAVMKITDSYNQLSEEINAEISAFKNSLNNSDINQKLLKIKSDGESENLKLKRLELTPQCDEYNKLTGDVLNLEVEIPRLQLALSSQQSQYLDSYFTNLNKYFRDFGSENFILEKCIDTSGHKPVYYLKIKFHGIGIPEADLDRVFSESDRRALALAIFSASIDAIPTTDKPLAIIVMDDPVTSFDNHRMSAIHRYIVSLSDQVRQVIILSHFEDDIARFLHTYRKNKPVKLLEIRKENNSSSLFEPNVEEFLLNDHQKKRESIFKFVNNEAQTFSAGDLRVFLEVEIDNRFAKQIRDKHIEENNLSDRIDALFNQGIVLEDMKNNFHAWREDLNPDHHRWTGSDIEDQRNTARRFVEFLYHQVKPVE